MKNATVRRVLTVLRITTVMLACLCITGTFAQRARRFTPVRLDATSKTALLDTAQRWTTTYFTVDGPFAVLLMEVIPNNQVGDFGFSSFDALPPTDPVAFIIVCGNFRSKALPFSTGPVPARYISYLFNPKAEGDGFPQIGMSMKQEQFWAALYDTGIPEETVTPVPTNPLTALPLPPNQTRPTISRVYRSITMLRYNTRVHSAKRIKQDTRRPAYADAGVFL